MSTIATLPKIPTVNIPKPPISVPPINKNNGSTPPLPKPPTVNPANGLPKPPVSGVVLPGMPDAKAQEKAKNKLDSLKETVKTIQSKSQEEIEKEVVETVENKEEVVEAKDEEIKQEEPAQEVKEEEKEQVKEDVKEEEEVKKEEPQETEKSEAAPKRRGRKKNTKNDEVKQEEKVVETNEQPLKETCKDFDEMEGVLTATFNDPKWEALKEEIIESNNKIVIETDMNSATLKMAISDLNKLRDRILVLYYRHQTNLQNLISDKPEGLIERTKRLNAIGSNDNERRRSGILACMQYDFNGQTINLFELLEQTRERYNFLKTIMDSIDHKCKTLITMNSAILMEQKFDN